MTGYVIGGSGGGALKWIDYATAFSSTPTLSLDNASGKVYTYLYNSDAATFYRFIAADNSEDSFYSSFDGTNVSGLVVSKAQTIT